MATCIDTDKLGLGYRHYFESDGFVVEDVQPLVYDFGTSMMKVGFSGEDAPRAVFPSIVGKPRRPAIMTESFCGKDCFVGDEALAKRGILNLSHPMPIDGTEVNFENLEKLIHHCPYELCVAPEEHPLFFTSFYNMTSKMFEKISEIFFSDHRHPALYCCDSAVCSLAASGRTTGTVLDCGGGCTSTCIYECIPIEYSKCVLENQLFKPRRTRIGGELIDDVLTSLLLKQGKLQEKKTRTEIGKQKEAVRDFKELHCYLAPTQESVSSLTIEENGSDDSKYKLPDGTEFILGKERYYAPEILFQPKLIGYDDLPGIHEMVKISIDQVNDELKNTMYKNIVVSGGTSVIQNFGDRLKSELSEIVSEDKKSMIIQVILDPARKYLSWLGGSIISSLAGFRKEWVGMNELIENGSYRIFQRKCQMATKANSNIGILRCSRNLDIDLKERVEYVYNACFVENEKSYSLLVKYRNSYHCWMELKIPFKSLLL